MFFVYNFLQIILIIAGFPILVLLVLIKKKYRTRILHRLGFSLQKNLSLPNITGKKIIWIHCLSVGEVTSSLPLVRGLKEELDNIIIVFSASTLTGMKVAEQNIRPYVDSLIPAPLDLLFTVSTFIKQIQPDLFILVETDFWPNWLWKLQKENIPAMLVNGRISKSSFSNYRRFHFLFHSMFQTFTLLSMQTEQDAMQMHRLSITQEKIMTLGNLKYDTARTLEQGRNSLANRSDLNIPEESQVWICGSTHRGEEEIILSAYVTLKKNHDKLVVIIAPRDPGRTIEIIQLATDKSIGATRRTSLSDPIEPLLILDTIGELTRCYTLADVAFIGGSLVDCGGHNPLEAASCEIPVLFGSHMEDFQEISRDLVQSNGGRIVHNTDELAEAVHQILSDSGLHQSMSRAAGELMTKNAEVVRRHIDEINKILHTI